MSYAVRNDGKGFRSIADKKDIIEGEHYSEKPPETSGIELTSTEAEAMLLIAYADPVTGSDRFFSQAMRLQSTGADVEEINSAIERGVSRYNEIKQGKYK